MRRTLGWIVLFAAAVCIFLAVALRSGLLRRHSVTVESSDRLLSSGHLIGLGPDEVVEFLTVQKIEYHQSEVDRQRSTAVAGCTELTAVIPNSSRGLLTVGDIMITFDFDDKCSLVQYHIREHFTYP
jgi:hypothetical protein